MAKSILHINIPSIDNHNQSISVARVCNQGAETWMPCVITCKVRFGLLQQTWHRNRAAGLSFSTAAFSSLYEKLLPGACFSSITFPTRHGHDAFECEQSAAMRPQYIMHFVCTCLTCSFEGAHKALTIDTTLMCFSL